MNKADKEKYNHPSVKPIEILNNFIVNSSNEGDIVLDPFASTGSTCVSAVKNNRHYIGFELSDEYCNTAQKRILEAKCNIVDFTCSMQPTDDTTKIVKRLF